MLGLLPPSPEERQKVYDGASSGPRVELEVLFSIIGDKENQLGGLWPQDTEGGVWSCPPRVCWSKG